tara:strand:- start:55 stop:1911 length:1857 start_codon:yes stop_codon:yes gene_type:complete
MVYKKYITRGGKRYGPYLYENKRVNGRVVTRYLGMGKEDEGKNNYKLFGVLIIISLLTGALFFVYLKQSGSQITGRPIASICGDGVCESLSENNNNCPVDCSFNCGNNKCDAEKNAENCPSDCGIGSVCGDGFCDPTEEETCALDCVIGGEAPESIIQEVTQSVSYTNILLENSRKAYLMALTTESYEAVFKEISRLLEEAIKEKDKVKLFLQEYPRDDSLINSFEEIEDNIENIKGYLLEIESVISMGQIEDVEKKIYIVEWELDKVEDIKISIEGLDENLAQDIFPMLSPTSEFIDIEVIDEGECLYPVFDSSFGSKVDYGKKGVISRKSLYDKKVISRLSPCNYQEAQVNVGVSVEEDPLIDQSEIVISDDKKEVAKITLTKPVGEIQRYDITLSQGDPVDIIDSCFNLVKDEAENGIDCGGLCKKVCEVTLSPKNNYNYISWILLTAIFGALLFMNIFNEIKFRSKIYIGEKALKQNDMKTAVEQYEKLREHFGKLQGSHKNFLRRYGLDYYLSIRNTLKDLGVNVGRTILRGEDLPHIYYNDRKIGARKIKDLDIERVKRLIKESTRDLKNGNVRKAKERRKIIDGLYDSLDKKETLKIRGKYLKFLRMLKDH